MFTPWILLAATAAVPPLLAEAMTPDGDSLFGGAWTIILAYVIGASPFGFLAGRMRGIDIRQHGSGNIGATNVLRVLGRPIGITVLVLDVLKGMVPVLIAQQASDPGQSLVPILAAIAAILGHNYTFWLGFKGGKGIATSAGAILPLMMAPLGIALIVWLLAFALTRYVSVASILAGISLPVSIGVLGAISKEWNFPLLVFACFLAAMATWRHKTNLRRLREGTEHKFTPGSQRNKEHPPLDDHAVTTAESSAEPSD